jgi:hypothetical protein
MLPIFIFISIHLGTNYTLVCPYVILAHFCELDWAASFGLDKSLVRFSVGLESFEDIRDKLITAFSAASTGSYSSLKQDSQNQCQVQGKDTLVVGGKGSHKRSESDRETPVPSKVESDCCLIC